jgi:hypothetical protein
MTIATGISARLGAVAAALALAILVMDAPARAADLTGTWQGTIAADGQAVEFRQTFSDNGYVLFDYTNNRGLVQTVELSAPGQVQWVPPGGGVSTVAVESIAKRPGGVSYVLHSAFERTSGGYLDQRYQTEEHHYTLTNEGLRVRIVSRAATYFGDKGGPTGGPLQTETFEGVLTKTE